jgi:hypothetical protein
MTVKNNSLIQVVGTAVAALFVPAFLMLVLPLSVSAADMSVDDGGSWATDSVTPYYDSGSTDSGSWVTDSVTPYYDSSSNGGTWVTDSVTPYYDNYGGSSYGGGYMTGGGHGGGYMTGGVFGGGYMTPIRTVPSNSNTNTNVIDNGNSCTAVNSCNYNLNAPTTVTTVTNPPPVAQPIVYTQPPVVYNNPPIVYNNPPVYNPRPATPYITLSQVPYTGLDLGFWGTIAYWGFLIFWCLVIAYLVVVKKVQNRIAQSVKDFLLGEDEAEAQYVSEAIPSVGSASSLAGQAPQAASHTAVSGFSQSDLAALASLLNSMMGKSQQTIVTTPAPMRTSVATPFTDQTDEFILSQISRHAKRA